MLLGLALSPLAVILANVFGFSLYSRAGLDSMLNIYFGNLGFNDILTNELLVNSYDFNSKQPRFFSKYFMQHDKGNYDVLLRTAVGGSSSAPGYFDPEEISNGYNITSVLIDGAIICNNPALYAYILASELHDKKKVRLLSIGTGDDTKPEIDLHDAKSYSKAKNIEFLTDFTIEIET